MPYTPPSQRSPASSAPSSPDTSRRPSIQGADAGPRPALPRSSSYLTKHRRTPSAVEANSNHADQTSPVATSEDLHMMLTNSNIRQSPPPVNNGRVMPRMAILSPPDSPSSSEDDDLPEVRGRRIENLKELHDAISQIPQHRLPSPTKADVAECDAPDAGDLLVLPSQAGVISEGMHHSFSTGALDELSVGARRISHSRSATEPNILISKSVGSSLAGSEENSDDELLRKPPMVRKKSGELVRPALRPPSRRRPSSMPGTPTFSKAVHFDSHLEHVRHFLQVDRPLAVSAGSSPVDNYDSDIEYPFPEDKQASKAAPPFEWEIILSNFPVETPARKAQAARLERVWLSHDQKCLLGAVIVCNLAFQKYVTCRFTLDYWKTTSEVAGEYVGEVRPKETAQGHDRFHFTIKLSDLANLENRTLYFCIRYNVIGQEFWDNNGGTNFQIDFRKKMFPQNGKRGATGAASRPGNGLPRSNRRPSVSLVPRTKSMIGMDEFGSQTRVDFDQSINDYLGESDTTGVRLKSPRAPANLASDNLSSRLSAPSGQAFANRYDFGASLTAAVQAAKDSKPDSVKPKASRTVSKPTAVVKKSTPSDKAISVKKAEVPVSGTASSAPGTGSPVPGTGSPSASLASSSYEELVNRYCFFGSKQPTRQQSKDVTMHSGRFDGADDDGMAMRGSNSLNSSSTASPSAIAELSLRLHGAQHHSLHSYDPSPYFRPTSFIALGASPVESPLSGLHTQRSPSPRAAMSPGQSTANSSSSAVAVGNFQPFAGTSPNEFQYQHLHDRFPFGSETHAATAIRG